MIETQEALDNVTEIVSTPGLSAIYVGPSDLAISLGEKPDILARSPRVQQAINHIGEAAKNAGVYPCLHTGSGAMAKEYLSKGWKLASITNDIKLLIDGANHAISAARD